MASSIRQLITVDNTFGGSPPPFTTYLIQTSTDPYAGTGTEPTAASRALTQNERDAIEMVVAPFGSVQWIDDPAEYRTSDLMPTIEGSAILGVGEPTFDDKGALVPVSLWCSGLCGTWFTYRLQQTSEGWQVTGIEGPRAVSRLDGSLEDHRRDARRDRSVRATRRVVQGLLRPRSTKCLNHPRVFAQGVR